MFMGCRFDAQRVRMIKGKKYSMGMAGAVEEHAIGEGNAGSMVPPA